MVWSTAAAGAAGWGPGRGGVRSPHHRHGDDEVDDADDADEGYGAGGAVTLAKAPDEPMGCEWSYDERTQSRVELASVAA
eukprot:gene10668-46722_t